ncbi:hypothetical protein SUGI_1007620 [Cryptomeria japonica]|nr:hypothetical protein SUGI_1007620 [Cryptomeria japonica]
MEDSLSNLTNDSVNQSPESPMRNGVPSYSVEIQNLCSTGCSIAQVHVTCGWFSTAVEIELQRLPCQQWASHKSRRLRILRLCTNL